MKEGITVRVYDVVGGPLCVSAEDGQKIYEKIAPLLREGQNVVLSFDRVETMISTFLNAAVGQLYGEFEDDRVRELLSVQEMDQEDMVLLKRVVDNAKVYFRDPERFKKIVREATGDEE
jgi:hypothetical protein